MAEAVVSMAEGRRKLLRLAAIKRAEAVEKPANVYFPRSLRVVVEGPDGTHFCFSPYLLPPDWATDALLGGEHA